MLPEISDLEGRLSVNVPRPAKYTTSTQITRLFLLTLLIFTAGLLGWLADRDLGALNALKAHGRTTLAQVDGKHITHGKSDTYYLDYTFDGNGTWVDGDESVDRDQYTASRPGDTLTVTFLPSDPQVYRLGEITPARIEAQQNNWCWGEFAAFLFFGLLLVCMETIFRQHLTLLRNGMVVVGTVINRGTDASQRAFFVTYQFRVDGRFAVASRAYSKKVACTQVLYEQAELGQALAILHHPVNPSLSIPYRMLTDVVLWEREKNT